MTKYLKLKKVARKDLIDGRNYIFKNGGVWRMGTFDGESNVILSGDMELPGVDNGLYEVPDDED